MLETCSTKEIHSDAFFRQVFDVCEMGIVVLDNQARVIHWTPWFTKHSGIELIEAQGKSLRKIFPILQGGSLERAIQQALKNHLTSVISHALNPKPIPLKNISGQIISQHIIVKPLKREPSEIFCCIQITDTSAAEIREQQLIEQIKKNRIIAEKLAQEKERAQVTLDSIADAVITTDAEGLILSMNPVAELLTGKFEADTLYRPIDEVFILIEEQTGQLLPSQVSRCLENGDVVSNDLNHVLVSSNGHRYAVTDSVAPIFNEERKILGTVLVFRDVTYSRSMSAELNWQAQHDPLTGLPNRRAFEAKMKAFLEQAKSGPSSLNRHHLLYLDLDQFKVVNDTCGHDAGDELLRQLTNTLQHHLRKTDLLARLGGDEFGVLLESCDEDVALRIANNIRQAVQDFRFGWQSQSFKIGVSIGVAAITGAESKAAEALSAADAACYVAKEQGRNQVHFHELDETGSSAQQREMQWISRIQAALDENRFVLYGQRIQAIQPSAKVSQHYEILLRMVGQNNELIPPGAFLPAAERFNLIASLDYWVVENLFKMIKEKITDKVVLDKLIFSINLSGASMTDDMLLKRILEQLDKMPILPKNLCFEVTETATIANLAKATKFLKALREKGCKIALDDFGSGLSSFAYLKTLPIDFLKIDGHFVKDIVEDPIDRAFVSTINKIGQVMGMETIAEFVENTEILEILSELGVNYAQGYGVHKPCPLLDILTASE